MNREQSKHDLDLDANLSGNEQVKLLHTDDIIVISLALSQWIGQIYMDFSAPMESGPDAP